MTTKKPQTERHMTAQEQDLFHKALRRSVRPQTERGAGIVGPPLVRRPGQTKFCECGHGKGWHRKLGCLAQRADAKPGDLFCPCPAFTPKKEEKR